MAQRYNEEKKAGQYQTAMICATILNANLEKFKRKNPFSPGEILGEGQDKGMKDADMIETAKTLTEFHGGVVSSGAGEENCQK